MKDPTETNICKDLNEVRENIDRVDNEIIKLIAERGGYVRQAAAFKKDERGVKMTERERKELIASLESKMRKAAQMLEYEIAAQLRDEIIRLRGEK